MDAPSLRFPEFSRSGPWKPLPFGELALLKNDKISPRTAPTSLPCIELEHLESDTGRILGSTKVTPSMAVKNRFEAGDVLFGKLRPNLRKYARPDFDGVCSQEIWVLSGLLADNGFLYQLVQTDRFFQATMETTGTRMPRADWKTVEKSVFFLPAPEEQQYLARFLSAADEETAAQRQVVEDLKRRRSGILEQLFRPARELEDGRPEPGQAPVPSRGSWRLLPLSVILTERREYAKKDGTYPHVSLTKDGVIP